MMEEKLKTLAAKFPQEVLDQISRDEKVWNQRFKWHYYDWTGHRTGRVVKLTPKVYRENGTGVELSEAQFREKRVEYVLGRLEALDLHGSDKVPSEQRTERSDES